MNLLYIDRELDHDSEVLFWQYEVHLIHSQLMWSVHSEYNVIIFISGSNLITTHELAGKMFLNNLETEETSVIVFL